MNPNLYRVAQKPVNLTLRFKHLPFEFSFRLISLPVPPVFISNNCYEVTKYATYSDSKYRFAVKKIE